MAAESSLSRTTTNDQAMRVVLTRPAERQQALAQQLRQAGCDVLSLPALTITPIRPGTPNATYISSAPSTANRPTGANETGITSSQQTTSSGNDGVANWQPGHFDALVFVSRAAWQNYWQFYSQGSWPSDEVASDSPGENSVGQRTQKQPKTKQPARGEATTERSDQPAKSPILACVGLATARQIAHDLNLPLATITYPSPDLGLSPDSEGLWELLAPKLVASPGQTGDRRGEPSGEQSSQQGRQVLIVRGQAGRDWLYDKMTAHGISVTCLSVYQRQAALWSETQLQTLKQWATHHQNTGTWLVTSAEGLAAITAQYEQLGLSGKPGLQPQAVVVVHERLVPPVRQWLGHWSSVAGASRTVGLPVAVSVSNPDDQSIAQAILALRLG